MLKFIFKRILFSIPILFAVSVITFFILHAAPGDPADMLMNPRTKPEDRARIRHNLGLDRPVYVQYGIWIKNITTKGDLGYSLVDGRPVADVIMERLPITLTLMGISYILSFLAAVPLGVYCAVHRNSPFDHILTLFSFSGLSVPSFWLALLAIYMFVVQSRLIPFSTIGLPVMDGMTLWEQAGAWFLALFLPVLVLTVRNIAGWSRYIRASMVETLQEDYIRTARALGISENTIIYKYALKPAMLPMITLIGLSLPDIAAGSFVIEYIFAVPGIGRLGIQAMEQRNYSVMMGDILIASAMIILANLITDIAYGWADPRIRTS
ncbi:MAG: ABC transporter permease [Firmicutes bacterium]|nr:ABC transporter permease [Bacillota bacterium]